MNDCIVSNSSVLHFEEQSELFISPEPQLAQMIIYVSDLFVVHVRWWCWYSQKLFTFSSFPKSLGQMLTKLGTKHPIE